MFCKIVANEKINYYVYTNILRFSYFLMVLITIYSGIYKVAIICYTYHRRTKIAANNKKVG